MSKLQKALQILKENREAEARAGGEGAVVQDRLTHQDSPGPAAASSAQEADAAPRPRVRTHSPLAGQRNEERLPARRCRVDVDALTAAGLYPDAPHVERVAQEFRRIKRPIINGAFGIGIPESQNANMIMIASALPKSGKTYCSINLAASIARERDVGAVLVDADVLKPNISRVLGLENEVGLIDHLLDPNVTVDDIVVPTDFHDIVVIPAGQQHQEATELLASRRMGRFVSTLSQRFASRAVIVDTPPLLLTNEAHVLAEHMGQIVIVIEAGVSTQECVLEALDSLNRSKPINAILNKSRVGLFGDYGTGAYGYYSVPQAGLKNDKKEE